MTTRRRSDVIIICGLLLGLGLSACDPDKAPDLKDQPREGQPCATSQIDDTDHDLKCTKSKRGVRWEVPDHKYGLGHAAPRHPNEGVWN